MTTVPEPPLPTPAATSFVGRGAELERLVDALLVPPGLVVVEGDAGIGKTRLLTEACADTRLAGRTVLRGACRRLGTPFPLGPVLEALRSVGEIDGLVDPPAVTGALRPVLPELSSVLPPAPEPLDDVLAERHRVFRGLLALLEAIGPAVLIVEDLHWADHQTMELIAELLASPPASMSLVVTFRGDEVAPWVRGALAAAGPITPVRLRVDPLDAAATHALASAALGVEDLSTEFGRYLWERAAGSPFAVEELLALLQARGTLIRRGSRWVRRALDRLDVPYRIRDTVLERVDRLSPEARDVAAAAAVLQIATPPEVVLATCDRGTEAGLEEALAVGLLTETGALVEYRHPLASQAVYDSLSGVRRRALHARAAAVLDAEADREPAVIAHHRHQAGETTEWARVAEEAAAQAIAMHDDELACQILAEVLREATLDPDTRSRLALTMARSANQALPDVADLTRLLADAIDADGDLIPVTRRGELRLRLAIQLEQNGADPDVLSRLYRLAVDDLDSAPGLQAWAMVGLGIPHAADVEPAEHRQWLHRALTLVPHVEDSETRIFLRGKVAHVLVVMGDPAWRELADLVVAETSGTPRTRREINAFDTIGMQACYAGHHRRAHELLGAALAVTRTSESPWLQLRLERSGSLVDLCRGQWDGLATRVAWVADDFEEYSRAAIEVQAVAACLALAHGELDTADRRLTDLIDQAESLGANDLLPIPASAQVRLLLSRGSSEAAVELGERVFAIAERKAVWAPVLRIVPGLVQALRTAGNPDRARAYVDLVQQALSGLDAPLAEAVLAHATGLLADDPDGAGTALRAAAAAYDAVDSPYEAAQAREEAARRLAEADHPETEPVLQQALATYRTLGASWDESRASRLARRIGVALPGRHRGGRQGYGAGLSPREREVAELVAAGRTNAAIAAELYLSVKTVEKHVSAAKRKLEVSTRAGLARHFPEAGSRVDQT